ncbi:P-loop containing nucleoside triphosphate hydrolase protein [Cladochytrium replicatum]|nr:P-loop containing nucleoside triphosphate hydrolase protein [Cladochytrium replicatum]
MAAICYAVRFSLLRQMFFAVCMGLLYTASPFWLSRILLWLQEDGIERNQRVIWSYLIGLACTELLAALVSVQRGFNGRRSGMQVRSILNAQIYEKSLRRVPRGGSAPKESSSPKVEDVGSTDEGKESEEETGDGVDASIGRIVTLMSTDTDRIRNFVSYSHELFAQLPVAIICSFGYLIYVMEWSGFIALVVILALLPLGTILGTMINAVDDAESSETDKRVNITNEVLQGIRIIKLFAWEPSFIERIEKVRTSQLNLYLKEMLVFLGMGNVAYSSGTLVTVVTFVAHTVLFKKPLTPAIAFTSLKLLHQTSAFIGQLPDWVMFAVHAKVSWDRVQQFLDQRELEKYNGESPISTMVQNVGVGEDHANANRVGILHGWFTYYTSESKPTASQTGTGSQSPTATAASLTDQFTLRDIDVEFPAASLSMISGPTGCGKTTLLLSLLGETKRIDGKACLPDAVLGGAISRGEKATMPDGTIVSAEPSELVLADDPRADLVDSAVAYVAQSAWLLNASIRENICFGLPFNPKRYRLVVRACALVKDLEVFEGGDLTEIGEKGINLSGGQKQRVSMARAAYSRAATILLDDPLSAVDAPTSRHLFKHCILGLMKNRTRLLVTHAVPLVLPNADFVLVMKSGSVVAKGPTAEIMKDKQALEILGQETSLGSPFEPVGQKSASMSSVAESDSESVEVRTEEDSAQEAVLTKRPKKLVEEELRETGSVRFSVYKMYIDALGGKNVVIAYLCTFLLFTLCEIGDGAWLATWANSSGKSIEADGIGMPSTQSSLFKLMDQRDGASNPAKAMKFLPIERMASLGGPIPLTTFITVYCLLALAIMLFDNANTILLNFAVYRAAKVVHAKLLLGVMYAPMRFFEKTPVGRILNRFSKDIQQVDKINFILNEFMRYGLQIVSTTVMLGLFLPSFLLATPIIAWIYIFIANAYLSTSRELKRLESTSRSPIYSLFSETLAGVTTIRAYGQEVRFAAENDLKTDENHRPWFYMWAANRWLCFRTDIVAILVMIAASVFLVGSGLSAGLSGLMLTYSLAYSSLLHQFVRQSAEMEIAMSSMERIREYVKLEPEPAPIVEPRPPPEWPKNGEIEYRSLSVRYSPDLPPALKNVTVHIGSGEKIGIVGRTGAGKSSFALSLFRIIPFDPSSESGASGGTIFIDGVDISKIGLRDLRSRMTIIPQDPVLFSGTLRNALDPLEEHDPALVRDSLERVQFLRSMQQHQDRMAEREGNIGEAEASSNMKTTSIDLSYPISENGSNLSQGQRQLLCMARALLRKSKVVVLDEATASVDNETDELMQRAIREQMVGATILTVAHRLRTIIDYDRILVLDQGEIVEFDTPYNLLNPPSKGYFHEMCQETGEFDELFDLARRKVEGDS